MGTAEAKAAIIANKTVSGHIALMISGQAFRTVIRIWQRM